MSLVLLRHALKRDTKGLYRKALAGEITEFTGVSSPYEPPGSPELVLESDKLNVGECVSMIIDYLEKKEVFGKAPRRIDNGSSTRTRISKCLYPAGGLREF